MNMASLRTFLNRIGVISLVAFSLFLSQTACDQGADPKSKRSVKNGGENADGSFSPTGGQEDAKASEASNNSNNNKTSVDETNIDGKKDSAAKDQLAVSKDAGTTQTSTVVDDSVYENLNYTTLAQYHSGCTSTTFSTGSGGYGSYTTECISAAQAYCSKVRNKPGAWIQEGTGDFLGIVCVKAAKYIDLDISTLTTFHEGCTLANAVANHGYSDPCVSAARRYCANETKGTGAITQYFGSRFGVVCTTGTSKYYDGTPLTTLQGFHELCTDQTVTDIFNQGYPGVCIAGAHRYCNSLGYQAGTITEYFQAKVSVDCIK